MPLGRITAFVYIGPIRLTYHDGARLPQVSVHFPLNISGWALGRQVV